MCRSIHLFSLLAYIAQYEVLGVFVAALLILTDSFDTFGLSDLGLSLIMLLLNLVIVVLALYWCLKRRRFEVEQQQWRNILSEREADIINKVMLRESTHHGGEYDDDDDDDAAAAAHRYSTEAAAAAVSEDDAVDTTTAHIANGLARREHAKRCEEILRQFLISPDDVQMEKKVGAGGEFVGAQMNSGISLITC